VLFGKSAAARIKKSEISRINQDIFDADQDCVEVLAKWAKRFRQDSDLRFESLESTVVKRYGDTAKYVMDKMAAYLIANNITATRSTSPGPDRLLDDRNGFLQDVGMLIDKTAAIARWSIDLENAEQDRTRLEDEIFTAGGGSDFSNFFKLSGMAAPPAVTNPTPSKPGESAGGEAAGGGHPIAKRPARHDTSAAAGSDSAASSGGSKKKNSPIVEVESTSPGLKGLDAKGISGSPFASIPDAFFKTVLKPYKEMYASKTQDLLNKGYNHDQAHLDSSAHNVKSQALLQNLLLTDDVLSEADPDQVVSAYNTIRQAAPQLANDINVMRVALRSAVQHQGIDPFTLKNFSDTESARQEVEENQRKINEREYTIGGGGGNKKDKKPSGGDSKD
jgi:hypothetical protein